MIKIPAYQVTKMVMKPTRHNTTMIDLAILALLCYRDLQKIIHFGLYVL